MVTTGQTAGWTRRLLDHLRRDVRNFRTAVGRQRPNERRPNQNRLRTFVLQSSGGQRRFHLRTHRDGSAVLLVDVTDAIHLNASAALLAELALDAVPKSRAVSTLRSRFRHLGRNEAEAATNKIYSLIARLTDLTGGCPTCGVFEGQRSPLFSLPITAPYKADLALTYGCNNACSHCYNRPASDMPRCSPLSDAQWHEVLQRLAAIGVPHVIFTGGEPTLYDGLPNLIAAAARLGLIAGLNSNGRRLADRSFAASLHAAGLDHVQITLESHRGEVHNAMTNADSFDETVQGLQNAQQTGLHTLTNTTITRQNVDHAGEIVQWLHHQGLRSFAMNGMIYSGSGCTTDDALPVETLAPVLADVRDRAARLGMRFLWYTPTEYCRLSPMLLELGPRRCNAGEYSMCVEPNGDVLPCQSYYVSAGNILRDPWESIWESRLFRSFRQRVVEPAAAGLPERCWHCPDLAICGGGCRLEREHCGDGSAVGRRASK